MKGLALILILSCAGLASAEAGRISGQIFEKGSKNTVPTAEIILLKTKFHAWSGLDGRFVIENIPPGDYQLTAVGGGFVASAPYGVRVMAGQTVALKILLEKPFFQGDEIVVKGTRVKSVGQQGLTREELKKIPGSFDDPLRGLQALPGVASPGDFATTFLLRGSGDYDNTILIDGVPIDLPFHLGGLVSTIHPDAIKSADLYSGGFGPEYGDAVGGVMTVATREPRRDRVAADLDFNPILPSGIVDVPLPGSGGLFLAARRSYFDLLIHHIGGLTVVPVFQDGIAKVSYDLSDRGVLSFTALGATDGFAFSSGDQGNGGNDGGQSSSFFKRYSREAVQWKWFWTDAVKSDVVVYHGNDSLSSTDVEFAGNSNQNNFGPPNPPNANQVNDAGATTSLWGARAEADVEWTPWMKTIVGGDYQDSQVSGVGFFQNYVDALNQSAGVNISNESLNGTFQTLGEFADQKFRVLEPLWISLGGRLDQRVENLEQSNVGVTTFTASGRRTETHTSPRVSFELAVGDATKVRGSWGKYYQWPSLDTPPFDVMTNGNLRAEWAYHYVLGVEHDFPSGLFARVEGFHKDMSNLIVDPAPNPTNTNQHDFIVGQPSLKNSGSGYANGAEFFVRKKLGGRFVGWTSYTYEVSRERLTPNGPLVPVPYDQNNILTVLGAYQFSRRWEFSAKWNSHTGNPYTPLESVANNGMGQLTSNYGPYDSARLPSYQRLDLRLTKTVEYKSWTVSYYFDIINATNHKNVLDIRYFSSNNNGNSTQVNPQVDKQFPLIPFFGIRCKY